MTMPKAYEPEQGYQYQILVRDTSYDREWESLDYAVDKSNLNDLMENYRLSYRGTGSEFKTIKLPKKYWKPNFN